MFACTALFKHTHSKRQTKSHTAIHIHCMYFPVTPPYRRHTETELDWTDNADTLRVNLVQPQTQTHALTHTHTHIGLVPVPTICVCLYVGLLYQGMCYINVWKWMNGCWNESFDIWKVQKVRLLHAVRANVVSLKKVKTEVCTQSTTWT